MARDKTHGWQLEPFGDVMRAVGNPGTQLFAVALGALADQFNAWELYFVGIEPGGILLHTSRDRDGNWTPLENLNEVLGGGPFSRVSVTGEPE